MKNKAILSISHTSYINNVGGMEKVILEQSEVANTDGYTFIALYPICNACKIKGHVIFRSFKYFGVHIDKGESMRMKYEELLTMLKSYDIHKVYIHSLISYPIEQIVSLLKEYSSTSTFFYVHDYKSICDGHNLLKNKTHYCGDNGLNFTKCFNCRFYLPGLISSCKYRHFISSFPCMKFIFPSEIAKNIWKKTYSMIEEHRLLVLPHQIFSTSTIEYTRNEKLKLAFIGYKSFNKGWNTFRNLVVHINNNNIDIELYVLGKTDEHLQNVTEVEVSFQKDGPDAMVKAIRNHKIDIAFLWSPWPETYSYTFFESYVGGSFIITNKDSGNIAVCSEKFNCGKVFNHESDLFNFFCDKNNLDHIRKSIVERPSGLLFNSDFINV